MLPHFGSLGHKCSSTSNPADFALDLVFVDLREAKNEVDSERRVEGLVRKFVEARKTEKFTVPDSRVKTGESGLAGLEGRAPTPMYIAMPILVRRGLLCFKRQPRFAAARVIQTVGLSAFIALFFAPLKTDYYSFQNRLGVIQVVIGCEYLFRTIVNCTGAHPRLSVPCGAVA